MKLTNPKEAAPQRTGGTPPGEPAAPPAPPVAGGGAVTLGVLAERPGLHLTQSTEQVLAVEAAGRTYWARAGRRRRQGRAYLEVTRTRLGPEVQALLAGRVAPGNSIGVHQLVAIVGRGAILRGSEWGKVAVHHVNLDPLDNRASNLRTLLTETHQAIHDWLDLLEPGAREAYLATVPTHPLHVAEAAEA